MKYVLMYCKIVDDKLMGTLMTGIYYGGIYEDKDTANKAAKDSAASSQGCTVIPKVFPLEKSLQETVSAAVKTFDKLASNIYESERILKKR